MQVEVWEGLTVVPTLSMLKRLVLPKWEVQVKGVLNVLKLREVVGKQPLRWRSDARQLAKNGAYCNQGLAPMVVKGKLSVRRYRRG